MQGSSSFTPGGLGASSRPFLNMINPMGRQYQGYIQANQSLVEDEHENDSQDDDALEAGHAHDATPRESIRMSASTTAKARGKQRSVAWQGDPSTSRRNAHTHALNPNIRKEANTADRDSSDDEVPQSFMIEDAVRKPQAPTSPRKHASSSSAAPKKHRSKPLQSNTPGSLPLPNRQYSIPGVSIPPRPSELDVERSPEPSEPRMSPKPMRGLDAYERALWKWVNVYNLDAFLQDVYRYYEGKGIYSIALARGLNLITVGFVIGFSTFLLGCVDYGRIRPDKITRLSDAIVPHCVSRFSGFTLLFFLPFTAFYIWRIISFVFEISRLVDMYNFYTYLLRIPDADIQTISWPEVVRRIGAIREENPITAISSAAGGNSATPATASLDAHDVANRIMRQENYLIALFNKDLLDLRVPLPPNIKRLLHQSGDEGKGQTLTRVLEWNLRFCLMEYLFDPQGRVRKVFLKNKNRPILIEGLRRRFIFMGILNAIFAPFIVLYMVMYTFFRYFDEYRHNPSSIGSRRYTPFAEWKFREFNELPHIFTRRVDESYPVASRYIGQFPNEKLTIIVRFVAFVAGSFTAVLLLATIIDPDVFLSLEITPHRTVFFYISIFGSVLAVARGMIPEDNKVFDPELLMSEVIQYTHYMPDEWKAMLHSKQVHQEFGELFTMKPLVFAQEIISIVTTPFVLWFSLPECAPVIVDFFHDFTVWVPGRGYVCSFAEFDFKRHGNVKFGAPEKIKDERMLSREGKMEKSFLNFKAANPDWNPVDPSGSLYLSRMADLSASVVAPSRRRSGTGLEGTTILSPDKKDLAERAQEYDRALRQSQHAALRRRQQMGASILGGGGGPSNNNNTLGASTMWQSTAASGMVNPGPMAQTAVLGDSQGSITMPAQPSAAAAAATARAQEISSEDLAADGGVGSNLGESYVDGNAKASKALESQQESITEEDELEDAGVLGLLAQIYATRGAKPKHIM